MIDQLLPRRLLPLARELGPVIEAPAEQVLAALQAARAAVAFGWSEPFTLDADGRWCSVSDEGVTRYCVLDALTLTGGGFEVLTLAEWELQLAGDPTLKTSLTRWLDTAGRTHTDVLTLFDRAITRVKAAARQEMINVA